MISTAWAQGGAASGAPPLLANVVPLVMIVVVFYFILIRPQQQKAKEHGALLAGLKRNDDVITTSGIYGKVIALTENIVTLEIAKNVQIKIDRPQIASLVDKAAADNKEKDKEK